MPTNRFKPTDAEALFFLLVFLTGVLIFSKRLGESVRHLSLTATAAVAMIAVVVFLWRKLRT